MPSPESRFSIKNKQFISDLLQKRALLDVFVQVDSKFKHSRIKIIHSSESSFNFRSPFGSATKEILKNDFYFKIASSNGNIEFKSKTISHQFVSGTYFLDVIIPTEVIRIQRRESYRVPCSIPATCGDKPEINWEQNTLILDISVGGARITTDLHFINGSIIWLQFKMPSGLKVKIKSVINRVVENQSGASKYNFQYGLQWLDLARNFERNLSYFITQQQVSKKNPLIVKLKTDENTH